MSALASLYGAERARLLLMAQTQGERGMFASPVFGEGAERPLLVFVGEAPGAEETKASRPFVGRAGRQLDALLEEAGIPREAVYITNAVKYRPVTASGRGLRNRTPDKNEVLASLPLLREELRALAPALVATLGNVPLFSVLTICGEAPRSVGEVHGRPLAAPAGAPFTLFPLYHPAVVLYNPALRPACEADARALGRLFHEISGQGGPAAPRRV